MRNFIFSYTRKLFSSSLIVFFSFAGYSQSLRFTDTNYVNLGNPSSLRLTDFTIEAWIKIEGHGSTTETGAGGGQTDVVPIISKGRAESESAAVDVNYFIGYRRSDMKLVADFEDNATSANHSVISNASLSICIWTHIAVSYNTTTDTWKFYINGVLDKTLALGGDFTPQSLSNVNACIGSTLNTNTSIRQGFFNGRIDEVRIWNVVRTDAQISANFNTELASGTGLAGRWGLNEGSGAVAANSISGGANGSLVNSPLWVSGFNQADPVTNSSVSFNGVHDYISFGKADGSAGNPNLNATSFTLEAWVKIDGNGLTTTSGSGGITAVPIIAKGRGEDDNGNHNMNYFLGVDAANKLVADFEESTGPNHPVTGTASLQPGIWTHVAATYGSGTWNLYINGVLDKTESEGAVLPVSNSIQHASIGSALNSLGVPDGFFNGKIDEVRIWSLARTGTQISSNYLNQLTSGTGLLGRWGLNENCNNTATNSVAGGATGILLSTNTTTHPTNGGPSWYSGFNPSPNVPSNPNPSNAQETISTNVQLCANVSDPNTGNLRVRVYGRPKVVSAGGKFSIIWLPDTQYYTGELNGGSNSIFKSQTNWIVANKNNLNIVYIGQLGDCTEHGDNNGNDIEWKRADTSLKIIENPATTGLPFGIPYGVAVGNHDQGIIGPANDASAPTNFYNQYFGEARFTGRPYYGGHFGANSDNHYELFSASGIDFISISLEFDPSATPNAAVLSWADNLLKLYSNRKGIIYSHYILNADGSFGTQGSNIYNALKNNPNLILMVSGHVHDESRRSDVFNGRTVHSVMSDYQGRVNGGNGLLRIFEFDPATNTISVKTFSPWINQFETDASSQFTLNTDLSGSGSFTLIAELPNVVSGSQACVNWNNLSNGTQYEWYVEVFDGENITVGPVWNFTTPAAGALPVSLLEFSATPVTNKVSLKWKTENEVNNDHFEVERSANGSNFQKIGIVAGAGNGSGIKNYSLMDDQPLKGKSFYRLKQVDADARYTYSPVVIVNLSDKKTLDVYPNPADNNRINLIFSSSLQGEVNVCLYDMSGRLQFNKKLLVTGSSVIITHQLPAGIYVLDVNAKDFFDKKKITIK